MKVKRWLKQNAQAEAVMYPFVFVIALVLILGFILSGLAQYAESGEMAQGEYPGMSRPFGFSNYTTIEADSDDPRYIEFGTGEKGYLVSPEDCLDEIPYPTDGDPFIFWEADDPDEKKYVHIIRHNQRYSPTSTDMWEMYPDFIAIRRHTGAFDWDPQWNNAVIPFSALEANWMNLTNVSVSEFQLSGSQDSIFINATTGPGLANFTTDLWNTEFNLFYGWSLFRLGEMDFWGAVSMVIYADIPGVDNTTEWLIHAFAIGTIIFVVFTMGTRLIPFLGD